MSIGSGPSLAGGLSNDPCKDKCPPQCPIICLALCTGEPQCRPFCSCCDKLSYDCCWGPGHGDGGGGSCGGPSIQPGGPNPGGGHGYVQAGGAAGGPIGGNPLNWLIMAGPPRSDRFYSSNANPASTPKPKPCPPPPGVPQPPAVPDSSAPYAHDLYRREGNVIGTTLHGLLITCAETGVSLPSDCSAVTFYHNTTGTKDYSTPGGTARLCASFGSSLPFSSGSAQSSRFPRDTVVIVVQQQ